MLDDNGCSILLNLLNGIIVLSCSFMFFHLPCTMLYYALLKSLNRFWFVTVSVQDDQPVGFELETDSLEVKVKSWALGPESQ